MVELPKTDRKAKTVDYDKRRELLNSAETANTDESLGYYLEKLEGAISDMAGEILDEFSIDPETPEGEELLNTVYEALVRRIPDMMLKAD